MPQMSPMNWTLLFMMFLGILLTVSIKMYFNIFFTSTGGVISNSKLEFKHIKWMW